MNYGIGRALSAAISFFMLVYYSNYYSSAGYGEYVYHLVFVNVVSLSGFQWARVTYTKVISEGGAGEDIIGTYWTLFVCVAVTLPWVYFGFEFLPSLIGLFMLFSCLISELSLEVLRSKERSVFYALQFVSRQVIISLVSIFLISESVAYPIHIAYSLGCLVSSLLSIWGVGLLRLTGWSNCFRTLKEYSPLLLNFSLSAVLNNLDKFLVISLLGGSVGGAYSLIVDAIKQPIMILMEAVNLSLFPKWVKAKKGVLSEKVGFYTSASFSLLLFVGGMCIWGVYWYGGFLFEGIFGEEYVGVAAIVSVPICLAAVFRGFRVYYSDQFFQLYDELSLLKLNLLASSLFFAFMYTSLFFIPSVEYAALVNLLTFIFSFGVSIFRSRRFGSLNVDSKFVVLAFFSVFVAAISSYMSTAILNIGGWWSISIFAILGLASFCVFWRRVKHD